MVIKIRKKTATGYEDTAVAPASHTHGEANLSWGGRNIAGSFGPIDAALVPQLGANRLAFAKASAVSIEYSRDNGATWTDYGATEQQKLNIFSGLDASLRIGNWDSSHKPTSAYKLRITLNTGEAEVYSTIHKFCILISTNGSYGCTCKIAGRTEANRVNNVDTWVTFADTIVEGWSGYNIINTPAITTYGNTPDTQHGQLRFIFSMTSQNAAHDGLYLYNIMGFGGVGWNTPSNMAKYGHIYSYDHTQNATFPSKVSASIINEGGTNLADKYLQKSGGTISGVTQFNNLIKAYRYGDSISLPFITFDKPGGHGTGIGPDGTDHRIKFGPCDLEGTAWVPSTTFNANEWYFQGKLTTTGDITENGTKLSDKYLTSHQSLANYPTKAQVNAMFSYNSTTKTLSITTL